LVRTAGGFLILFESWRASVAFFQAMKIAPQKVA